MRSIGFGLIVAMLAAWSAAQPASAQSETPAVRLQPEADPATESPEQAVANDSATELAKKLQNPVGNLISVPFQYQANFNYGPNKGTQSLVNIQPVIPIKLNENWNVITRTILPLIWQPSLQPAQTVPFGTGPTTFSAFLSPANPVGGWVWGVGPVIQVPSASSKTLGSNVWGAGPTAVIVHLGKTIVYGALVNDVISAGGSSPRGTRYNTFTVNPFLNYNFPGGWFIGSVPVITANWLTTGSHAWTLPLGAQVGRLIRIGKLPVNLLAGAYYNALRPQYGATWQLRTQIAFIF